VDQRSSKKTPSPGLVAVHVVGLGATKVSLPHQKNLKRSQMPLYDLSLGLCVDEISCQKN